MTMLAVGIALTVAYLAVAWVALRRDARRRYEPIVDPETARARAALQRAHERNPR